MRKFVFILFLLLFGFSLASSQVIINEICSSNAESLLDEDYEASDWIELYNSGYSPVRLKDWRIYDKNNFEKAWVLPDTTIGAKSYLILFASDKNRISSGNYLIEAGGQGAVEWAKDDYFHYEYLKVAGDFDISVKIPFFQSGFFFGLAGLMLRDSLTARSKYISMNSKIQRRGSYFCLFREEQGKAPNRSHAVKPIQFPNVFVRLKRENDTVLAYLLLKNSFDWLNFGKFHYDNKDSVYLGIAISGTENGKLSKGLFKDLVLNGDTISFAKLNSFNNTNQIFYKRFYKELHTNFSLSKEGETVFLWNNKAELVDSLSFPELKADISYGRYPNGENEFAYFYPSTPSFENANPCYAFAEEPEFSIEAGWHSQELSLTFLNSKLEEKIYYTLNSSEPNENSFLFEGNPIEIDKTTIVRAKTYAENSVPSQTVSKSYFIEENTHKLPVVSVIVDSIDLWDRDRGIMNEANVFKKMEVEADFEFYEKDKSYPNFSGKAGMKLHGFTSRAPKYPQKSLSIIAKSRYALSKFEYPFFKDNSYETYDKLLLRNAGGDWGKAFLRDGFACKLALQMNLGASNYRPAVVYINGEYYGLQNLRERIDDDHISIKYAVSKKNLNLIEDKAVLLCGSRDSYLELLDFIENNDMSNPNQFKQVEKLVDLKSLINYFVFRIWSGIPDWPERNQKYWSSTDFDGKWRWVAYDSDIALGNNFNYINYSLFVLKDSTKMFSKMMIKLLENEQFKHYMLNGFAGIFATKLHKSNTIPLLESIAEQIKDEIPSQQKRWEGSVLDWENEIHAIKEFLLQRNYSVLSNLLTHYKLKGIGKIVCKLSNIEGGDFKLHDFERKDFLGGMKYFQCIPVTLEAVPKQGYEFVSWGNPLLPDSSCLRIAFDSAEVVLNPIFKLKENPEERTIIFNEIMYKSSKDLKCDDWVELYNTAEETIDISNWIFKDDDDSHIFLIPEGTSVKPKEYLVLCENEESFSNSYPNVKNYIGSFSFGLGRPDIVRLFDASNNLIDSVAYSHLSPWDENADGTGFSLELDKFNSDNNNPANWYASHIYGGTPGELNSEQVSVQEFEASSGIHFSCYPNPLSDYSTI
ncbi:MAG: hypothetical protein GX121_02775, partial [Ignavibacteria bacterium]|nr:hypothetical protein [Ignavibacteria bacterium]